MFPPLRQVLVVGVAVFVGVYLILGIGDFYETSIWPRIGLTAYITGCVLAWLSNRRQRRD